MKKNYHIAILIPKNATKCYVSWIPARLLIFIKASTSNEEYLRLGYIMNLVSGFSINTTLRRIDVATEFVSEYIKNYSKLPANITI